MQKLFWVFIILCVTSFSFADSGDTITIVVTLPELKPEFSINTLSFESGTKILISQTNTSRFLGSYSIDVNLYSVNGSYKLSDFFLSDNCSFSKNKDNIKITAQYDGTTKNAYTVSSWTMQALNNKLSGLIKFSFSAL